MRAADLIPGSTTGRIIAGAVALLLVIGAAWFVIDRLFYAPRRATTAVAAAKTDSTVAKGETNKATDARVITEKTSETIRTIERQTVTNERLIRAAPGSGDLVSVDVDAAGRRALCLRHAYRSDPACQQLLSADPVDVARADPGSGPAARP